MDFKLYKIVVFTPEDSADRVREYLANAGCGNQGNYSDCSFSSKGIGRFKPNSDANPTIGEAGKLDLVNEEKIEVICSSTMMAKVVRGLVEVHPYEEPAIDIIPVIDYHDFL